jgi:phosphorylase kinase alpha/beta subunit
MVDSISPYATQIIVNGKTLTVGTVGVDYEEFDKPCTPQEIHTALYSKVQPYNIIGAVLQQALILYCGKIIATKPEMFDGILCLRMARFVTAIEMYHGFVNPKEPCHIENLAPSKVRKTLMKVLELTTSGNKQTPVILTSHQVNSLNGCLTRVPANFYPSVYSTLQRCPGGLTFLNKHLPQEPTIQMMDPKELSFYHMVENLFAQYVVPHFIFLMIRVLTILATVLKRNPAQTQKEELKIDNLIKDGVQLFLKDHNLMNDLDLSDFGENTDLNGFLSLDQAVLDSYIARAIVNLLLGAEIGKMGMECKLQ